MEKRDRLTDPLFTPRVTSKATRVSTAQLHSGRFGLTYFFQDRLPSSWLEGTSEYGRATARGPTFNTRDRCIFKTMHTTTAMETTHKASSAENNVSQKRGTEGLHSNTQLRSKSVDITNCMMSTER